MRQKKETGGRQKWREWAENEDNLTVLSAWARAGKTDQEIAKEIGISRSTLSEWKKNHESIRKALHTGKEFANRLVENSLYKKALGFYVTETKAFKVKRVEFDDRGRRVEEREELQTAEQTRYIEADTKAIALWLHNCMPEKWNEKLSEALGEDSEGAGMICIDAEESAEIKRLIKEGKEEAENAIKQAEKEKI